MGRRWTLAEDDYLCANHRVTTFAAIGSAIGRSSDGVAGRVKKLGLSRPGIAWNRGKKLPSSWNRGLPWTESAREKMRIAKVGRALSLEHKAKIAAGLKGKPKTLEHNAAVSRAHKRLWLDPGYARRVLARRTPSALEMKLLRIIQELGLPLEFVGDGKLSIGGKNPDFANLSRRLAVEVFYQRHKERFRGGVESWKRKRRRGFAAHGWTSAFFDETQVTAERISQWAHKAELIPYLPRGVNLTKKSPPLPSRRRRGAARLLSSLLRD